MGCNKKMRGVISVFLIIILVPCLLLSSILVDVSRVQLAKAEAESAGDLALNALLAHFDTDLNDWYGLVASCQSVDQFYEISKEYFMSIVTAQDLSGETLTALESTFDFATGGGGDQAASNLLQMTVESASVSEVAGANLQNPAIMKDQIVEFMKYRAPIELTRGLIGRLTSDNPEMKDALSGATEAEENEDLVEAKRDYYETEGELRKQAYYSYLAIKKYYLLGHDSSKSIQAAPAANYLRSKETVNILAEQLESYRETYKDINRVIIFNLIGTENLESYQRVSYKASAITNIEKKYQKTGSEFKNSGIYAREETQEDDTVIYYYNKSTAEKRYNAVVTAESDLKNAISDLVAAAKAVDSSLGDKVGDGDDDYYFVQWWKLMGEALKSPTNKVRTKAEDLIVACAKLDSMLEYCEPDPEDADAMTNWNKEKFGNDGKSLQTHLRLALESAQGTRDSYIKERTITAAERQQSEYLKVTMKLEELSQALPSWDSYDPSLWVNMEKGVTGKYSGEYPLSQAVDLIQADIDNYMVTPLNDCQGALYDAIYGRDGGGELYPGAEVNTSLKNVSLVALKDLAQQYKDDYEKWVSEADKLPKTKMAEDDETEIAGLQKVAEAITPAAVDELSTRLKNISDQFGEIQMTIYGGGNAELPGLTYCGKKIYAKEDTNAMLQAARAKFKSSGLTIGLTNRELKETAEKFFQQQFSVPEGELVKILAESGNTHNPDIDPSETNRVDTPELYVTFHAWWENVDAEEFDQSTEEQDKAQERVDDYEAQENGESEGGDGSGGDGDSGDGESSDSKEYATGTTTYRGGGEDITPEYSGGSSYDIGDSLTGIIGLVKNLCGDITALRDDLYVTTYIMNMFSYATFDREAKFALCGGNVDSSNWIEKYKSKDNDKEETGWLSTLPTDSYNKSLTGKMINQENNQAYLAEVEYILCGGTNSENIKSVYGNIFAIRYLLNLISSFQHFWKNGSIDTIAIFLSSATCYIVPATAFKVVLLLMLTAVETCLDNKRLSYGFPVKLYKTKPGDWFCAPPSAGGFADFVDKILGDCVLGPDDGGLFYSDYLCMFLYLGLSGNGGLETCIYQRIGELIQANLNKKGLDGFSLANSKVYFKLEAQLRVKPLMITAPLFDGQADALTETVDWCTFTVDLVRGYS